MGALFPPGLGGRIRNRLGLLAVLIACNLVLYLALLAPAYRQRTELREARTRLESVQPVSEGAPVDSVAMHYAANQRDLKDFYGRLLPRADFDRFLGELFEFSSRAGLELDRISFQPDSHSAQQILEYRLRFNLNGSYDQIREFIHLLETSPRLIAIRTLSLSGKTQTENHIRVGMEIDTFFNLEAL